MEYEQERWAKRSAVIGSVVIDWSATGSDKNEGSFEESGKNMRARRSQRRHELPAWLMQMLIGIERWTRRSKIRIQAIRSLRNILYFGLRRRLLPQRQRVISPAPFPASAVLVAGADFQGIVPALQEKGFHAACRLRPDIVAQLQRLLTTLGDGIHTDVDEHHSVFQQIVNDPGVLRVVSDFLGCEPVLLECKLAIGTVYDGDTLSSGFHFDHAGAPSLNLMAYITDIDENTAPHVVIEGTQAGKRLGDFFREMLPMSEAIQRFQDRIRTITGPAGTVIFENTEAFHTRVAGHKRRAILNVLYSVRDKRLLSLVTTQRRLDQRARDLQLQADAT